MKKPKKKQKKIRDIIPIFDMHGNVTGHLDPNDDDGSGYYRFVQVPGHPPERVEATAMRLLSWLPPRASPSTAVFRIMHEHGLSYAAAQTAISAARVVMRSQLEDRPVLVEILKSMHPGQIADLGAECKKLMSEKGLSEREARKRLLLGARQ